MNSEEQIGRLLAKWDELRSQGRHVEPEELCVSYPELLSGLKLQIAGINAVERRPTNGAGGNGNGTAGSTLPHTGTSQLSATSASGDTAPKTSPNTAPDQTSDFLSTPLLGTFGDYELLEEVARGGMGVVYKALQKSLNRVVALKTIRADCLRSDLAVQRFYQEARAVAALDHPNIVPIYEIAKHDDQHYFTMAYVDGGCLQKRIRSDQPLPVGEALNLLLPVVDAIAYAHACGIIHRDLKPHNVLIDSQGRPRVVDFGLARQVESDVQLTAVGQVVGTPAFMSPEQALGNRSIGPPTDVYALGAILYTLLTGSPPFHGDTATQVLCKVMTEPVPDVREKNPDVPEALAHICHQCLNKQLEQRFPNAGELSNALRRFQAESEPPQAAFPTQEVASLPPAAPPRRSVRRLLVASLLLIAGISVVAGFLRWNALQENDKNPGLSPRAFRAPSPLRQDFALRVELPDAASKKEIYRFADGDRVSMRITVDRDAYVQVWSFHSDGSVVRLFPNDYEKNDLFKKGVSRTIPNSDYSIVPDKSEFVEELRVCASVQKPGNVRGQQKGGFQAFLNKEELDALGENLRGLHLEANPLRKDGGSVAEETIRYHVQARR